MAQKFVFDLEGKKTDKFEHALLEEDAYDATIHGFKIALVKKYDSPKETEEKIICEFKIGDAILPGYFSPVVSKAREGTGYSNSKLYDFLYKAGQLESLKNVRDSVQTVPELIDWLNNGLIGSSVRITVGTSKKGTPDAYSVVKDVLRFSERPSIPRVKNVFEAKKE